jgi:mannose-6-phosphate isomerase-like protein (cupin superfamily)
MKWIAADQSPLTPASHEDPRAPGVLRRIIAIREDFQAGHVQMLNWAVLPPHKSFRLHLHQDMQEVFVLIRGHVEMRVAADRRDMQPGDTVIVDAGEVHQMTNLTNEPAEYLVFGISSGRGGRTIVVPDQQETDQ